MYETMMYSLRAFMGNGVMRVTMFWSLVIVVGILAIYGSPPFRAWMGRVRGREGWRSFMVDLGAGIFKLSMYLLLARLFITGLNYQTSVFQKQHGRITEANRSAVTMKWGHPHEQKELSVHQTRKRIEVTRELSVHLGKGNDKVWTETYWKDEGPPLPTVKGKRAVVLSETEVEKEIPVEQKSLAAADVSITLVNNPRQLGNANYAGYEDTWTFKYVVQNKSEWTTAAAMTMPLPAERGLFDRMHLRIDGSDALGEAQTMKNTFNWTVVMAPGSRKTVEFGYSSRGLEHLRYLPAHMSQTGHYRVSMDVAGIPAQKLDYPIGSMPPAEDLDKLEGTAYTLTWNLDNAMSDYDIGIKLPEAEQPEQVFIDLLHQAPAGAILLVVMLIVPGLIAGQKVRVEMVAILGVLYCLHCVFMARLADVMNGFAGPFLISAAATILLTWWISFRTGARDLLSRQNPVVFAVMAIAYPLAIIDADRTDFWMVLFYLAMIVYACILLVRYRLVSTAGLDGTTLPPGPANPETLAAPPSLPDPVVT